MRLHLLLLLLVLAMAGCANRSYSHIYPNGERIELSSTTLIYGPETDGLVAQDGPGRMLQVEKQKSDLGAAYPLMEKALSLAGGKAGGLP